MRINIQTLTKEQLISLLVKLNSYAVSAIELELLDQYVISGYNIADWIGDLKSKLEFINSKDEEQKLKMMESKLDKLLSDDKKVELELNEIANMLND